MRKTFLFCVALSLLVYGRVDATIKLLVSTYDGFVIAADSRVTLSEKEKHRIASDSYQKIFRIGKSVGVACSGAAFLYDENGERRNVGSIVDAYKIRNDLTETTFVSPKEAADSLRKIVEEIYDKQPMNLGEGAVNLWVFGYDEEKERKIFEVTLKQDSLKVHGVLEERYAKGTPGSLVGGQIDVYFHLIKGYGAELLEDSVFVKEKEKIDDLRYNIRYDIMSLQDAIDFAVFIVRATIEAQRFNQKAVMGVGGDIDIAIITPEGFKWIQKKKLHGEGKPIEFENTK